MRQFPIEENKIILDKSLILYHCGHEQCKPSHSFGPAIRPHYLFHYILHGQGNYYVNGSTYHLQGGQGFLIYPGITTFYAADDQDPWEYCWIGFDGYEVNSILQNCDLSQTSLIFTDHNNSSLWEDFMALINVYSQHQGNEYTYLGLLYRCFSQMYQYTKASEKLQLESYMRKALDYIHHNYTYDIKITDIAQILSIDRTYLYKLFMLYRNTSPQQYLIEYRLKIAQKLLRESDLSVTEVAYSCGFKDASSFNKHFKNHFHTTPMKYRSNTEKQNHANKETRSLL
ncbi:MAG TPA: AraC family transcriptional regulator [Mobilitalea sp.]|nr:AraC family transcriptional regulator [Mobilitalea sp.]